MQHDNQAEELLDAKISLLASSMGPEVSLDNVQSFFVSPERGEWSRCGRQLPHPDHFHHRRRFEAQLRCRQCLFVTADPES